MASICPTVNNLWHMNCDIPRVARKYQITGMMARSAADSAAMNLRTATLQMAGINLPPRVRPIPPLRRRLPVTIITDPPETVIIRHIAQSLDTSVIERRQIQSNALKKSSNSSVPV